MYVSSIATPLTETRPCASQHVTWSPGSPMTLLMRCSPASTGRMPMKVRNVSPALTRPVDSCCGWLASQPPGSLKTTTSPRWMSRKRGTNREARTLSSLMRVFSMDSLGMTNGWTTKVLMRNEMTRAATTITPTSRANDQRRRVLTAAPGAGAPAEPSPGSPLGAWPSGKTDSTSGAPGKAPDGLGWSSGRSASFEVTGTLFHQWARGAGRSRRCRRRGR
ncbi:hypothetical protein D3C74_347980 [compost metagenome]